MPVVVINTNVQRSAIPDGFLKGFSKLYAETVKRDEKAINCSLCTGVEMIRAGSDEPAAVLTIRNTVAQDAAGRRETTRLLMEYIKEQWKMTDELMGRFTIVYLTPGKDEIGTSTGMLSDR